MKALRSLRYFFFRAANDNISAKRMQRALNPPHDATKEKLHGRTVKDIFRPLEKLDAPETAAWVARENARYDDFMRSSQKAEAEAMAFFEKARAKGMQETMPFRYGKKYFVWRTLPGEARASLYVKDAPDYGAPATRVLDPAQIDPDGKTGIVNKYITADGKTMAYRLSVSGSDRETLRFMDLETGKDLDLVYTNFRSAVNWDLDGKGFYYAQSDEKTKSTSVRYHRMGTKPEDDEIIYAPETPETSSHFFRLYTPAGKKGHLEWVSVSRDTGKNALLARPLGSTEAFREVFPHKLASLSPFAEIGGRIYAITDLGAPNGRLVSFDAANPAPEKWETILPENGQDPLTDAFVWKNKIFATYSHDTGQALKVFDFNGKHLHDVPIPPLSTFTLGQRMGEGTCLITYNSFKESGNIYKYNAKTNKLTLHKESSVPVGLKDCIVERVFAPSKDGTKVPMTVIRHPDTKLDGTAATILYGYGGFNVPLNPGFNVSIAQWVRAGGIYVQSNLRGGGEFGPEWYDAGRKENKQNVFDDFAACAEHLIRNSYTSNKRLAIQGGSNGGLLTLATMIQRPELFGAVVSEVPVADMFRFHIGSYYGYSWKSDYGDPGIRRDFNIAAKYSPLHNVKKGFKHPPLLIKTDAHDDRVLPWHSYKMAATLQAKEDTCSLTLLKIRTDGGHSAGMTTMQRYADIASVRAFLVRVMGPVDQKAYKAWLARKAANNTPKPPKAA